MHKWPSEVEAAPSSDVERMHAWFAHVAKMEKRMMDQAKLNAGRR